MLDNMAFTEIDTPIDIPCLNDPPARTKYPFGKMEVGDSFLFAGEQTGGKVYIASQSHGRYNNKKFSGSAEKDGMRITRIE